MLNEKLKRLKTTLTNWSKDSYGEVFFEIATMEDIVRMKEVQMEFDPFKENRAEHRREEADLKRFLRMKEEYWKQNACMSWFMEENKNTKFFHSYVKGRRKILCIQNIEDK